jgi:hypothetical protein
VTKIHSINENVTFPPLKLQSILNSKDSVLCMDILKFAKQKYNDGFRFTNLGNWLLKNNQEFLSFYQDSDAKIPKSARIANRRQRIQKNLDDLSKIGLLRIKSKVRAERNYGMIPLYDATLEGYLLACLLFTDSLTYNNIIRLIASICKTNDSSLLRFIIQFFKQCKKTKSFGRIVSHFIEFVLPSIDTRDAKDILLSFLGHKHIVNWILLDESSFLRAIENLGKLDKKIIFFQIKMEIENYYLEKYRTTTWLISKINAGGYITSGLPSIESVSSNLEEFSKTVGLPNKQWLKTRLEYSNDFNRIVVPGYCPACKSEKATIIDINTLVFEYSFLM